MSFFFFCIFATVVGAKEACTGGLCGRLKPFANRPWNSLCGKRYDLSEEERDARIAGLGSEQVSFIMWAMDVTDDWNVPGGNPINSLLMHRRDEMEWLKKRGVLPRCDQECSPRGSAVCVASMRRTYNARSHAMGRSSMVEQTRLMDLYMNVSEDDDDTEALVALFDELEERRKLEIEFMDGLAKRQGVVAATPRVVRLTNKAT